MKKIIRKATPKKVKEFFAYEDGDEYATKVYSQEGEDILLKRIFEHSPPGFYIDVGAHHPFRFSNTKLLYDMGWNGINIDANPGVAPLFKSHRSRDVFINKGISQKIQILEYFKYTHSALNTFEKKVVDSRMKKPVSSEPIEVQPLAVILNNTVQLNQKIDLMSIDTEGYDLEVLKSNDWDRFAPNWILVEIYNLNFEFLSENKTFSFLNQKNYILVSKLYNTCIFRLKTFE